MPAVKILSIHPIELAHADREIGLGCLDRQMIMIGHQTAGVTDPPVTTDDPG